MYATSEKGHGRHSEWSVECYEVNKNQALAALVPKWQGLATLIRVHRKVVYTSTKHQKNNFEGDSYYISSLVKPSALVCFKDIRGHWDIENKLHYEKDVVMLEDSNRISNDNAAINIAVFNTIAINYFRQCKFKGIYNAQTLFGYNFKELYFNFRT